MTLTELQVELREVCTAEVSIQTITRTLQREGYTMKTVHHGVAIFLLDQHLQHQNLFRSHGLLWSEMNKTVRSSRTSLIPTLVQSSWSSQTRATSTGLH